MHPHEGGSKDTAKMHTLTFQSVRLTFEGCGNPILSGQNKKETYQNFFLGNNPAKWATGAVQYSTVKYDSLYPGISGSILSEQNNFRYDFHLSAFANAGAIRMKFEGQESLTLRDGKLIIGTRGGDIVQNEPLAFQTIQGNKIKVKCKYVLAENEVGFKIIGPYNPSFPLTIDPTLVFATYTGSYSDNWGMSATYDLQGNGYSSGICFGPSYPVTPGAFQTNFAGGVVNNTYPYAGFDIVVSKFNSIGSALLFSTYLGGSNNEEPQSIIVDNAGNLIILGRSYSNDFPVTGGVVGPTLSGGSDIILTKFNSGGTALLASTFFGGSGDDGVNVDAYESYLGSLKYNYADDGRGDVLVDAANNVYVASCTQSPNFPYTMGAIQNSLRGNQDACVFKLNSNFSSILFSTYLGGNSNDAAYNVAFDMQQDLYITGGTESSDFPVTPGVLQANYSGGIDGFVSHISNNGSLLKQSSFLGTAGYDQSYFVQTDKFNNVYVYGQTNGNYPVSPGVYSNPGSGQFIQELDPLLSVSKFSTRLGSGRGVPDIAPSAFLVDNCQNIYLSGWGGTLSGYNQPNSSTNGLPLTSNAYQNSTDGSDFYFMVLQKDAVALWYATYYGGPVSEEHVDGGTSRFNKAGEIYQAICEGCGGYSDLSTTPGAWSNTNNSFNCNNALVKFKFDMRQTVSLFSVNPVTTGCTPYLANFQNFSSNSVAYSWNFGDGSTSGTSNPSHLYSTPGTYTIMLISTDTTTCNMHDTSYSFVRVVPAVNLTTPPPNPVCQGDSVQLQANSLLATSFSWTPTSSLSNPNIANPLAFPNQTTIYQVTASDSFCSASASVTVKINVPKIPHIAAASGALCQGDSMSLQTQGGPFSSYLWSSGQSVPNLEILQGGLYIIGTLDSNGCKGMDSLRIALFTKVPLLPGDTTICYGQKVRFNAPQGNYQYIWTPAGTLSSSTLYDPLAQPLSNTIYTLVVINGPCSTSTTHTVNVDPLPQLSVKTDSLDILDGESILLQATSNVLCVWSPNSHLSCTQCYDPMATPDGNITYYVTAVMEDGCSIMDSVRIFVEPAFYIPNSFTPDGDDLNEIFKPVFSGYDKINAYIFDRWGVQVYHWMDLNGGWDGTYGGVPSPEDVYTYLIVATDFRGKELKVSGTVSLVR